MSDAQILASLGPVTIEPTCIVPEDPGEVVRVCLGKPDERAARMLLEQHITRLQAQRGTR